MMNNERNNVIDVLRQIRGDTSCRILRSTGIPKIPKPLTLPDDLRVFYEEAGGAMLHEGDAYAIEIVTPKGFVRANPVIVGSACEYDISHDWFIIGQAPEELEYITIDLSASRRGRCYDSFWDSHGLRGDCPIIARSFTELLVRLYETGGGRWYWLEEEFRPLGDAYD